MLNSEVKGHLCKSKVLLKSELLLFVRNFYNKQTIFGEHRLLNAK
jgi:hypothetical protein